MLARFSSYFIIIIFIIIAIGLFAVKDSVGNLSYQLAEVNRQIAQEKNTIHLLKAEISYLTTPERLRKLATNYLELDNVKPAQMTKNPLKEGVDSKDQFSTVLLENNMNKKTVKWRYKRIQNKYLKTVSERR